MKKILLICIAAIVAISTVVPAAAQMDDVTTLYINVTAERQEIIAGPYARYAQKYLGVVAPLADKVLHEVTSANILESSEMPMQRGAFSATIVRDNNTPTHMNPAHGFPRLTIDKTSASAISLEESARQAADKIFEIRRSRLDLITGNIGENVFGGGLESALRELSRLEEEYLSLFLGKQTTQTDTKQYSVTPSKGKYTYTVCRFSDTAGLLPEDDLSGEPVVLELKYTDGRATSAPTTVQEKPNSKAVPQLVPADMQCRIILNGIELTSKQLRIQQLGETVYVN
jgi:hypothetical protein